MPEEGFLDRVISLGYRTELCWIRSHCHDELNCFPSGLSMWICVHAFQCSTGSTHIADGGSSLTAGKGDVYAASLRRLSAAVALSSPRADTQILSRNSLAQCLMVHQYQVQCDTQALLPPSHWALLPGHLWLSAVQLPHFWSFTPSTSMILMNPPAFCCQSIIEKPLRELFTLLQCLKIHKGGWVYPASTFCRPSSCCCEGGQCFTV